MKTINLSKKIFTIILFSLIIFSCKKDEDQGPPPPIYIIESDTSGTLGELIVHVYYSHGLFNPTVSVAPSYTQVNLYPSIEAYAMLLPMYQTYTYLSDEVYFGFLSPGTYVVEALNDINGSEYYGSATAVIIGGILFQQTITMEKVQI
ncbi:MAG: hypothetical protein HN704_12605 [Bacteroidetes bacterium]|nr:hypothetical protein [Bacteroidota bacterium]MBT7143930.1 hypothetical protein [Bacteroidota bacterium]MBT7492434.1 hypothetical protein [Bacteroidota bacterium]